MSKYKAVPTVLDNIRFASKREAARYAELKILRDAGKIDLCQRQPRFPLEVNGVLICTYVADFQYFDKDKQQVITEDVKGVRTPVYKLKKRLVKALHNIDIQEV